MHEGDDPDAFVDFLDADVLILTPSCPRDFSPWAASGFPMWRARETGEVQKVLNIAPEASFALSIRNPEASSPAGASLPQTEKADYPDKLQEEFRARRFAHEDVPRLHLPRMGTPIKPLFEGVWE